MMMNPIAKRLLIMPAAWASARVGRLVCDLILGREERLDYVSQTRTPDVGILCDFPACDCYLRGRCDELEVS